MNSGSAGRNYLDATGGLPMLCPMSMTVGHLRQADPVPNYVDGDMNPSQICQVLADLRFSHRGAMVRLELDRDARDYLVRVLSQR
jgi:hypothetical protein